MMLNLGKGSSRYVMRGDNRVTKLLQQCFLRAALVCSHSALLALTADSAESLFP